MPRAAGIQIQRLRLMGAGEPHHAWLFRGLCARPVYHRRQSIGEGRGLAVSRAAGCRSLHHALPMAGLAARASAELDPAPRRDFRVIGMKTMIKLFYAPHTCSLASHIALEEAGAAYTTVRVDFASNGQRQPEYLAINPKGRVPALSSNGTTPTETPAILAFIAQSFPNAGLAPFDDPFAFAQVQAFNSYLCSTVHVAHAHRMRGNRWADDPAAIAEMKRKVPQSVGTAYDLIEHDMLKGPWVMGETYSICDPYLFTMSEWLEGDGVDLSRLPEVIAHRNRMSERRAVRKAIAEERG